MSGERAGAAGPVLTGIGDEAALGIAGQIAAVSALGWGALELRTVDGTPVADLPPAAFDRVAGALADAGVAVPAVDARIGGWARPVTGDFALDLAELDVLARRCARLGTPFVRVMSFPDGGLDPAVWEREVLRRVRELARRAHASGLTLLHENCAGWAGADADRMIRLLDAAGPGLALLHDTGNGPAYGYDALSVLTRLLPYADRIAHVHVKDAVVPTGRPPRYCVPGTGDLQVAESLRLLLAHGYRGALSIEPHLAVRPHEGFRDTDERCGAAFARCGAALRRLLEQLPGAAEGGGAAGGLGTVGVAGAVGAVPDAGAVAPPGAVAPAFAAGKTTSACGAPAASGAPAGAGRSPGAAARGTPVDARRTPGAGSGGLPGRVSGGPFGGRDGGADRGGREPLR